MIVLALAGLLLVLAPPASAHVTKVAGPYRVSMGWRDEPPFAGFDNSVEVGVSDASGTPVKDVGGELEVEVSFGGARIRLPLRPTEEPGDLLAAIVPTRPGTYAFHVTGTVKGRAIDTRATCSDRTFECVSPVSEVQFPAKDPSAGEVAQRLGRGLSRTQQAADTADSARSVAIGAIVVAALALAAVVGIGVRGRRKS